MADLFSWNGVIVGALICVLYGCFLAVLGRSQNVRFGKVVAMLGITGTLVLAGMAYVGTQDHSQSDNERQIIMIENEGVVPQRNLLHKKFRLVYYQTLNELGNPPSKDHVAYQDKDGKRSWILAKHYTKIRAKEMEGESK